jgi:hypothetical protein
MSLPSWVQPLTVVLASSLGLASAACSSSSPAEGGPDGGTPHDSSVADRSTGDAPATGNDASHPKDSGGDASSCAPESTASFKPTPFVSAVGHQGVCTTTQTADFINACIMSTSAATCGTWQTMNLMVDGGTGTPCGNCILPNTTDNNGALWLDPLGEFWPNYGACLQVSDPTHGVACGTAYDNLAGCEDIGCDSRCAGEAPCATSADCEGCFMSVGSDCASYITTVKSACATDLVDGGALDTCSPSSKTGEQASDFAYIIELICGGGGPSDGGAG